MRAKVQAAVLAVILIACTVFTLGLTWAPCYSSLCSEQFYPAATRYHIATYFALIASIALALHLRAHVPACHRLSTTYLIKRPVPIINRHLTVGGVSLAIWVVAVVLITTIFWIPALAKFWGDRAIASGWKAAETPLVVTATIAHHFDLLLGLLLIPVGRNSLLSKVFRVPYSTLLFAHKLLAYVTVIGVFAHGAVYVVFWASYNARPYSSPGRAAFEVNNPTLSVAESQARGAWSRATLGAGLATFIFMLIIVVTALPALRRRAYNLFYFTHIVMALLIFIGASFHASTNFYALTPGLLLWTLDWAWRVCRGDAGLFREVEISMSSAGGDWYRIVLPVTGLTGSKNLDTERQSVTHSTLHPLQTYFVNIPAISKIENHALTAAKVSTNSSGAVLLLQKVQITAIARSAKAQDREWTWKLARLIDGHDKAFNVKAHIEGPYQPPYQEYETANLVICVVGGTGLTGGYSLATWWYENRRLETSSRFVLIWTVRHKESLQLEEWTELAGSCATVDNMSLRTHCSSIEGRLDIDAALRDLVRPSHDDGMSPNGPAWVYASGPSSMLETTSNACILLERDIRRSQSDSEKATNGITSMTHCTANWEV